MGMMPGYGMMGGMMGGMPGMLMTSPPVQTLYMLNSLVVSAGMMADMLVQNYRQFVLLRERVEALRDGEGGGAEEGPMDRALRWLFKRRGSRAQRLVKYLLSMAVVAVAVRLARGAMERAVEGRVRERLEAMEVSFDAAGLGRKPKKQGRGLL